MSGFGRWLMALLLAALPILSCGTAVAIWLNESIQRQRAAALTRHVEMLAVAIDSAVLGSLRSLETLAGSRQLELADLAGFREEARRLLAREATWHTIALVDGSRQLLNLRYAPDRPPPAEDLPVGRVLATGRASARDLPDGRILLSVPVHNEGAVRGALVAVLEAAALAGPLGRIALPPDWSALLLGREGQRLAGGPVTAVPREALEAALAHPGRPQRMETGLKSLAVPVGETGWTVVVSAPPDDLLAGAMLWLGLALVGAALSGAAGMSLALRGRHWGRGGAAAAATAPDPPALAKPAIAPPSDPAPVPAEAAASARPMSPASPPGERLRILIAEDVPASRLLLQALLQRAGYRVDAVEDGRQAMQALRGAAYDLVVLDLNMPEMGGLATAAALRALPGGAGRMPVVALTAERSEQVEAECLAAGFDAVMTKPVEARRLVALVEALRRDRPEDPPRQAAAE